MIDKVNASEADFLAVSLGAKKGQLWLHRNHQASHRTGPRSFGGDDQFPGRNGQARASEASGVGS